VQELLRRTDNQVDALFTSGALSQQSSSIDAPPEEVHLHCQFATLQDRMTMSTSSLGESTPMYLAKYFLPLALLYSL
jgi:hypothetical protein